MKIAIIGMGYVGLPLSIEFAKLYETIGFDIQQSRIDELLAQKDSTLEVTSSQLKEAKNLSFTLDLNDIRSCNIFIITVPTPIDENKKPDLGPLIIASQSIGKVLKKDDIVIYESTVYPGATEEICVPILIEYSGLKYNSDFFCGYSPERVNPGDKKYTVTSIKKITSGSTKNVAKKIDDLYSSIITAGTFKASSIRIAEAAKVIENTQRDVNIALINELSMIFNKLGIDTNAVLEAAGTKWNFLPFKPGLVGGHCIGVDPYYLTHKAIETGYHPEMILAGRRINDYMSSYVVSQVCMKMNKKRINIVDSEILIMGLTFKENCPDLRNTKVIDMYSELINLHSNVDIFDPWVNKEEAMKNYGIKVLDEPKTANYDAVIIAVAHDEFKQLNIDDIKLFCKKNVVIYDIKNLYDSKYVDGRL